MKDLHLLNGVLYKVKREKGFLRQSRLSLMLKCASMGHGSKNCEIGIVVYQLID
jgi:hypothetical protein